MRLPENEKNCATCAHSYMGYENFKLRQKCRSPERCSPAYTQEMFMEDRERGVCRFWTSEIRKGN